MASPQERSDTWPNKLSEVSSSQLCGQPGDKL